MRMLSFVTFSFVTFSCVLTKPQAFFENGNNNKKNNRSSRQGPFLGPKNNNQSTYTTSLSTLPTQLTTLALFWITALLSMISALSKFCCFYILELRCVCLYIDFKTVHYSFRIFGPGKGPKSLRRLLGLLLPFRKMPKALLIHNRPQRSFAYTFVTLFPTNLPSQISEVNSYCLAISQLPYRQQWRPLPIINKTTTVQRKA